MTLHRVSTFICSMAAIMTMMAVIDVPSAATAASGDGLVLVEDGKSLAPIIVSEAMPDEIVRSKGEYGITSSEFRAEIRRSADELAEYIERVSGARPEVIEGTPESVPAHAIWVGYQPILDDLFPALDFEFEHPEEILIAANENHLVIAGRDRGPDEVGEVMGLFDHFKREVVMAPKTEEGTANAVATFLQKHLGVRWLWPGELGEDVPRSRTIAFKPFVYRHHPQIRGRKFHYNPRGMDAEIHQWWHDHQRSGPRGSQLRATTHSSSRWWERFHETHPEYFALQSDGTREPRGNPRYVKLCVSNPGVAAQWLDDAEKLLRENPTLEVLSMMPTDGGGWCVCEECQAWDHPDAPRRVLTERYVKFWNILARGLKERFPNRDIYLDQMAYATYRTPPIETELEDNIAIRYVGHLPLADLETRRAEKEQMRGWAAAKPRALGFRPNILWYDGGFWGMPAVDPQKTIEDFRFLAEMKIDYLGMDSVQMHFATLAPQLYLMAQLAYDPSQDGHALLADYYDRGFGPAAEDVRQYFELMADAHTQLVEVDGWRPASGDRRKVVGMIAEIYTPEFLKRAQDLLDRAKAKASGGPGKYEQRVAYVQTGLDFVTIQLEIIPWMAKARNSAGRDRAAVKKAIELSAVRDEVFEKAPPYAFDVTRIQNQVIYGSYGMQDYLGPPSEELRNVEAPEQTETTHLAVADSWHLVFRDDFEKDTLGDAWNVVAGEWAVEDGHLVSSTVDGDSAVMAAQAFPGLHRIEFEVTAVPRKSASASDKAIADISAFIQSSPDNIKEGYFLQFGGRYNTTNVLFRQGNRLVERSKPNIVAGREYTVVAEFDGKHVRMKVDDQVIVEYEEEYPLVGAKHERVGLYFYTPVKVNSVRIYTAVAREAERWDDPDME